MGCPGCRACISHGLCSFFQIFQFSDREFPYIRAVKILIIYIYNYLFIFTLTLISVQLTTERTERNSHFAEAEGGTGNGRATRKYFHSQAELDYLYNSRKFGLVPIEVKSGTNAHLKSLQEFMSDSPCRFAIRFWNKPLQCDSVHIERKDNIGNIVKSKDYTLYSIPYYYAGNIDRFLENTRDQ